MTQQKRYKDRSDLSNNEQVLDHYAVGRANTTVTARSRSAPVALRTTNVSYTYDRVPEIGRRSISTERRR
jgi:hypothetical protein